MGRAVFLALLLEIVLEIPTTAGLKRQLVGVYLSMCS